MIKKERKKAAISDFLVKMQEKLPYIEGLSIVTNEIKGGIIPEKLQIM